jgi:Cys-rich protein (TIGR01571 family)
MPTVQREPGSALAVGRPVATRDRQGFARVELRIPSWPASGESAPAKATWRHGLFDCGRNLDILCEECCCTYCHLAFVRGYLRNPGDRALHWCMCLPVCFLDPFTLFTLRCCLIGATRRRVIARYNLDEGPACSYIKAVLCSCCAMCQAHQEMDGRFEFTGGVGYIPRVPQGPTPVIPERIDAARATARTRLRQLREYQWRMADSHYQPVYLISGQPQALPHYGYSQDNCTGYPERYEISGLSKTSPLPRAFVAAASGPSPGFGPASPYVQLQPPPMPERMHQRDAPGPISPLPPPAGPTPAYPYSRSSDTHEPYGGDTANG